MWSVVDFMTMQIVNVEENINLPSMQKFVKGENDLDYQKIPPFTNTDCEKEFEVRYNDIDVNRHANNGNYIIWALEPLSFEFKTSHKLKTIDMVYKKEIKYGEKLISKVQVNDNSTIHVLKNAVTNEDVCLVHCIWE